MTADRNQPDDPHAMNLSRPNTLYNMSLSELLQGLQGRIPNNLHEALDPVKIETMFKYLLNRLNRIISYNISKLYTTIYTCKYLSYYVNTL